MKNTIRILTALTLSTSLLACGESNTLDELANGGIDGPRIDADIETATTLSGNLVIDGTIDLRAPVVIEPGTEIRMTENSGLIVASGGSLACTGTASDPISITGATETPGFWETIRFDTNDTANEMSYCNVSYGGAGSSFGTSGNENASVIVNGSAQLQISNSRITHSRGEGLTIREGATVTFQNNAFASNGGSPIRLFANRVGILDTATDYGTDNGNGYVDIVGNDVSEAQTWAAIGLPLRVGGIVSVELSGADVLTVDAGAELIMGENAGIEVNGGAMSMVGTATNPILVRGEVATAGYWQAIVFRTNNPGNALEHVNVSDGGSGSSFGFVGSNETSVFLTSDAQLALENSTISNSRDSGVRVENSADFSSFIANTFNDNGGPGLRLRPRHLVQLDAASVYGGVSGSENGDAWVDVIGNDSIDGSGSWVSTDVPFRLGGTPTISTGVNIDVVAGASLLMSTNAGISVNGRLTLSGTAADPVTVSGDVATPGTWQALVYESNNTNSIDHAVIEYGGSGSSFGFSGSVNAQVIVRDSGNLSLTNSEIRSSESIGLQVSGSATLSPADPVTSGGNFFDNTIDFQDDR